ncbi:MAG: helix-turn-helix domain-containing protein [Desulfobulbus sp.]|uniref:helix-turn-helix domain-containing protein n=1 Tax=Desulfobulbus sp. TaxID=895 RepID=UPI00283CF4D9|nr:helix-turn-helix domain-containing protein [Desulfobulbus sp.]MDR2549386.1 helix-turn-helix domain-containing protein [Desulfobulbus sp.]
MTDKEIQAALRKARVTQLSIANMLKVKPPSVHNVISGKRSTPRIQQAIAFAIGRPVNEVFPVTKEET